jgi:excisionase family DNA binding protein
MNDTPTPTLTPEPDDPFGEDSSVWDFMTIGATAELARLSEQTIRRWIREGRIKAYGHRGCLRVRMRDLMPAFDPRAPKSRWTRQNKK